MLIACSWRSITALFLYVTTLTVLGGCATPAGSPPVAADPIPVVSTHSAADVLRIAELERQIVERQRRCTEDKRRLESALKESQRQIDELQKKLDTLVAIDREISGRGKAR